MTFTDLFRRSGPRVAVIRLQGAIAASGRGVSLNDQTMGPIIERAFRRGKPVAVALVINSPGGSPVQSSLIASRIRRLADEKSVPVIAFVEDVAASGGYWLAVAADEIMVDATSIVGSIGVITSSFGLQDFIARHGVERRVHTAGKSKSMLDPFQPEKPADVKRLKAMLEQMHDSFIAHVKSRRGAKLTDDPALFTGEFWVGSRGVELGLADGIAHLVPEMKKRYGDKVRFVQYGPKRPLLGRIGASLVAEVIDQAEERAAFARYGI